LSIDSKFSDNAYAFLLVKYIDSLDKPQRFLALGFNDISTYLATHFVQICKGDFIRPTGDLAQLSNMRKNNLPCLIALDWQDVGKYASWTTSFKILTESQSNVDFSKIGGEIYDSSSIFFWLAEKDDHLEDLMKFICKELDFDCSKLSLGNLKNLLSKFGDTMKATPSFAAFVHIRKIIDAIILSILFAKSDKRPDFSVFLRGMGMESNSELSGILFFENSIVPTETLQKHIDDYQKVVRNYLTVPYEKGKGRLRKSLSNMGLYLIQHILVALAENEKTLSNGIWTDHFIEFEQVLTEKKGSSRKYDVNHFGTKVMSRSPVSGLPSSFRFVLQRNSLDGKNLLLNFFGGDLALMMLSYKEKFGKPNFELLPIKMDGSTNLTVECQLGTDLLIDPFLRGLSSPNRKINSLMLKLGIG
jgi:hypothetical protein